MLNDHVKILENFTISSPNDQYQSPPSMMNIRGREIVSPRRDKISKLSFILVYLNPLIWVGGLEENKTSKRCAISEDKGDYRFANLTSSVYCKPTYLSTLQLLDTVSFSSESSRFVSDYSDQQIYFTITSWLILLKYYLKIQWCKTYIIPHCP